MKYLLAFTAVIAVATAASTGMAPLMGQDHPDVIPGEYVVVFHKDVSDSKIDSHHELLAQEMAKYGEEMTVKFKYSILKGYSAKMNDRVRDRVRLLPEVKYVNTNQKVQLSQGEPCSINVVESWGVPRTAGTGKVVAGYDSYEYLYDLNCDGAGVDVYIIDTGIDLENTRQYFEGRAKFAVDYVRVDGLSGDPNGHGTHVAGTVASKQYGIAPEATVHDVRVLNSFGSGTFDTVVAGVDYVSQQTGTRRVINMSIGGGIHQPLIDVIEDAFRAGIHVVVAAGNENTDACTRSPAAAPYATTVGASDDADARATFSNYGNCVDIFAPGVNIWAPFKNGIPEALSGTSMASPHVAGVVAKMLTSSGCRGGVSDDPLSVENHILEKALSNAVSDVPYGTSDLLHMPCN